MCCSGFSCGLYSRVFTFPDNVLSILLVSWTLKPNDFKSVQCPTAEIYL